MAKPGSRWVKGNKHLRQSASAKVEDARFVADRHGTKRLVTDQPTEVVYCQRRRESSGWRHGARIRAV